MGRPETVVESAADSSADAVVGRPRPTAGPHRRPRAALLSAGGLLVAVLAMSALSVAVASGWPTGLAVGDVIWAGAWSLYAVVGSFLAWRRPGHPVGWLFLAAGVLVPIASLLDAAGALAAEADARLMAGVLQTASEALWIPALVLGLPIPLALFPDGRPLSPRWAWGVRAGWAAGGLAVLTTLLPGLPVGPAVPVLVFVSAVGAVASLAVRWRRADSVERRQLLWLAFAVLMLVTVLGLVGAYVWAGGALSPLGGSLLAALSVALLPAGAAVAVVRSGLLDIDLVVRRSVALVLLASMVTAAYLGVFVGLGALGSAQPATALLATVLAACVAVPLHARLRAAVDRRLFGHRDPYRVLAELGTELQRPRGSRPALRAMLEATRLAVRSPGAAIVTRTGRRLAVDGRPADDGLAIPLVHDGATVGTLVVAPRSVGEPYSDRDRRVLGELAPHLAGAAALVRLTDDVQEARERLVLAREEERRRLRRDLHDGMGPTLAAISMQVALEREAAPDAAAERLAQVQGLVDAAVTEVRRLVDGLRPPALDDLGVVAAVHERAAQLGLEVDWRIDDIPPLSAAAEAAIYRIAGEALTNVARHAGVRACRVQLGGRADGGVRLVVTDSGRGPSGTTEGTGRASMRERAEELGGACVVREAVGGGTEVVAELPA